MVLDRKAVGVVVVSLACLAIIEFLGKGRLPGYFFSRPSSHFAGLLYWALCCVLCYAVIPASFIIYVLREDIRDYGFRLGEVGDFAWAYVAMMAVVLPLVLWMSTHSSFQQTYPFYRESAQYPGRFWTWQIAYALQFIALEFFFRGFLVHGVEHRLGWYAVVLMTVPYCLIHLGKPTPEVIGSIFAGLALGVLSLRTGSILWGAAAHVTVALSMDLLCLWRSGSLKSVF